jgi:hypothetical protein
VTALPTASRIRLAKLLGRLGSDAAGERAAAGLLADRMVRAVGMTSSDVVTSASAPPQVPTADHRLAAALALASGHLWTPWERWFLAGIGRFYGMTVRQERVLLRLCRRAGVPFHAFD